MTKEITLKAELRQEKDGKLEKLDPMNFIPAIIYGPGAENKNLKIKKQEFDKIYAEAGESNLINLQIGSEASIKVLIKDLQRDVVKDFIIHADLYQVDMTKKITTEIPLEFIGESKAVKELGGILVKNMDAVEVQCLPTDLVDHIEVDLAALETFSDSINLHDLKLPQGMELTSETNDGIATVAEPKIQEEETPAEEEGAGEEKAEEGEKNEEAKEEAPAEAEKKE